MWAPFILLLLLLSNSSRAAFIPVPLKPESFNQDIVVERTAPAPLRAATTASMDAGWTNTGFSFYEKGYYADWPATGLPLAGSIINSDFAMDHTFQFAPDYRSNNAVLVTSNTPKAQIQLVAPSAYTALSLLLCGANDRSSVPLKCIVHFQDCTSQTNTLNCPDWMDTGYSPASACSSHGRVNVVAFTFANLNSELPILSSGDITLTNSSPVQSLDLEYVRGSGLCAVFALSAATENGGTFVPVPFAGFNADLIVESTANRPEYLGTVTTATMEGGSLNNVRTWFESGYAPGTPASGLPGSGLFLTNSAQPEWVFQMPSSYATNNAIVLDNDSLSGAATPVEAGTCSRLCLLSAAYGGPVTSQCVAQFGDGKNETNTVVVPDWMDQTVPAAWTANGRVNLNNRLIDLLNSGLPRLFAVEIPVGNLSSPFTNLLVSIPRPGTSSRVAIFAVSASTTAPNHEPVLLSAQPGPAGTLVIRSSGSAQLQAATRLDAPPAEWQMVGSISESSPVSVQMNEQPRFFRAVGP